MAIKFFDPTTTAFMKPVDVYPDSLKERLTAAEVADTSVRLHHGEPGKLQLFEISLEPGLEISTHAHADDEIIAVVEGTLHFGRPVCGRGFDDRRSFRSARAPTGSARGVAPRRSGNAGGTDAAIFDAAVRRCRSVAARCAAVG